MPNGPASEDAVRIASETSGLGVGIHLSLVDEHCVAPPNDLQGLVDDSGRLPASHIEFVKSYMLRRFGLKEIRAEVEAQVARVLDSGIKPTHIDSHQHLHVFPGIIDVVLDVARQAGIGVIRIPDERNGVGERGIQRKVLSFLCRKAAANARKAGFRVADHFWGFGVSGHMNEANLARTIDRLGDGVNEIMCHPGESDPATSARYQWGYDWDDEADALHSETIKRTVEHHGIRLASFSEAWEIGSRNEE